MTRHPREGGRKRPFSRAGGTPIDRRAFLQRSGLAATSIPLASALLAACDDNGTPPPEALLENPARPDNPVTLPINDNPPIADGLKPEKGPLQIYNWEEYVNPRSLGIFEEQYGVKVELNTFNTMNDALATLTNAGGDVEFDVFFPTIDLLGKLAATNLIKPLNKTYIPNLEANPWAVYTGTQPEAPFYDVGALYTAPYVVYTTGVAWRIDEGGPSEDEVLGLSTPYDIFWDENYRGKIHILDDYREAIAMPMMREGIYDVNTDDAANRTQNLELSKTQLLDMVEKVAVQADISDYTDLPEAKSLIHQAWSGDMVGAQYYFPAGVTNKDVIRYWAPEENMMIGNDCMAILNNGKNPVLAHHFINFMLDYDQKTQTGNSIVNFQWLGYLPPMAGLDNDNLIKGKGPWRQGRIVQPSLATCLPVEEDFELGQQLLELTPEIDNEWKAVWEAFQSA